jgi:mannose-6-phosphate isomerase class I
MNGILRLKPTFVPRVDSTALGRLGVKKFFLDTNRGYISERWIASSVEAINPIKVQNEGLSYIALTGDTSRLTLQKALEIAPDRLLGSTYAETHENRFGVLSKILDNGTPIPWHLHANQEDAMKYWNMNGKEEAYYFLDAEDMGPLPYSHIAVHPDVTEDDLIPILKRWCDDTVLDLSPAYRLNRGEGFHIVPGIPHAPGTALTLEIQEESDVYNTLQAVSYGVKIPKNELLFNLPNEEAVVKLIDWKTARDPFFYRKYKTYPEVIENSHSVESGVEYWIFHPSRSAKFCGKEVRIYPGKTFKSVERGACAIFVWKGEGCIEDISIHGGIRNMDELFVSAELATQSLKIVNTGITDLILYKLFGPDMY